MKPFVSEKAWYLKLDKVPESQDAALASFYPTVKKALQKIPCFLYDVTVEGFLGAKGEAAIQSRTVSIKVRITWSAAAALLWQLYWSIQVPFHRNVCWPLTEALLWCSSTESDQIAIQGAPLQHPFLQLMFWQLTLKSNKEIACWWELPFAEMGGCEVY